MSFDVIAPVYDLLSRAVYGRSIVTAQQYMLKYIEEGSSVLIVGGGTGWIIEELFAINTTCTVVYMEASQKMLEKAQARIHGIDQSRIQFLLQTEIPSEGLYDVVITNFFLDLFPSGKLVRIIQQLKNLIKDDGSWIVTDFVDDGKHWQQLLLNLMYFFFRNVSKIEAAVLPPWRLLLAETGMQKMETKRFYAGFIETAIYQK
jgi:ubiquinone/menaquinone biosynthesis C-methylase UbiE